MMCFLRLGPLVLGLLVSRNKVWPLERVGDGTS